MRDALNAALRRLPRGAVWAAGLIPFLLLAWDTVQGRLGVDPVRMVEHRSGRAALYFLVATLCVTPLLRLARINAMRFRRALGMLSFLYAVLHVAAWAVLDMGLAWAQIGGDLLQRSFLTIGTISLLILAVLAATATDSAIRRLGAGRWRAIHRWIYVAAPLAGLHWLLSEKVAGTKAEVILAVILSLLAWRGWMALRPTGRIGRIYHE